MGGVIMDKRLELQRLVKEYKEDYPNLSNGQRWDRAESIRKLVMEIKRDKIEFYVTEYLDALRKGGITEIKRAGVMVRQTTKEYENLKSLNRYTFEVEDYE